MLISCVRYRANDADDIMLSSSEIKSIALDIEEEMFSSYGGVNSKYKHKFRGLATQLKDMRNKVLGPTAACLHVGT